MCNCRCKYEWFQKWDWLHYSVAKDSLLCYVCKQAYFQNKLFTAKLEKSLFLEKAFLYGIRPPEMMAKFLNMKAHFVTKRLWKKCAILYLHRILELSFLMNIRELRSKIKNVYYK